MMSRMDESSPPGVSSSMTTASYPSLLATVDRVDQVVQRDRVDVVRELDRENARRRLLGGRGSCQREHRRKEQNVQKNPRKRGTSV